MRRHEAVVVCFSCRACVGAIGCAVATRLVLLLSCTGRIHAVRDVFDVQYALDCRCSTELYLFLECALFIPETCFILVCNGVLNIFTLCLVRIMEKITNRIIANGFSSISVLLALLIRRKFPERVTDSNELIRYHSTFLEKDCIVSSRTQISKKKNNVPLLLGPGESHAPK